MSQSLHTCDDGCTCPIHRTQMIYWPAGDEHACGDRDCLYFHGIERTWTRPLTRGRQYEHDTLTASPGIRLTRLPAVPSITCPVCGMTSYNETDAEEGFCGNCSDWTTPRS